MAALTALASAQQRDPISGKALVTIPSCKDAYLHGIFVQYRIPASFPRPESEGTASEVFRCEDVRVEFFKTPESNYLPERIRVSAGNWMKAWAFITKGNGEKNYVSPLYVDTGIWVTIANGLVNVNDKYKDASRQLVVGIKSNGGALRPVLFDGAVTPRKILPGINEFFFVVGNVGPSHNKMTINTTTGVIEFSTVKFP
ncbi:hypothetical protein [Deinococcus sp. RM]|uniref:hypothetical protein n=1 Tax=Deinococcus sp. RM TaxID=2316359 RepID=UPI000E68219F|nr:hypothetical protein [Deinococcus sp. RM]RIX97632.1 hypothetical protein D3W47_18490 [Deinococcus sp. RM]